MNKLAEAEWQIYDLEYEIGKLHEIILALATGAQIEELSAFGRARIEKLKAIYEGRKLLTG